jgi:hypothetical protein
MTSQRYSYEIFEALLRDGQVNELQASDPELCEWLFEQWLREERRQWVLNVLPPVVIMSPNHIRDIFNYLDFVADEHKIEKELFQ